MKDLQYGQSLDYPTIEVNVDRERAGLAGLMPVDVSRALVTATSSSRFVVPNYWADPKSGIAYQVQIELPRPVVRSPFGIHTISSEGDLASIPLKRSEQGEVLIRDVATIQRGTMPGQYDRYNMRRQITLAANVSGVDLGTASRRISAALARATGTYWVETIKNPDGKIITYQYDTNDRVTTLTDTMARSTTFTWDSTTGKLLAVRNALGAKTTYAYSTQGVLTTLTDAVGKIWSYTYDTNGHMTASINPLGQRTTYVYDVNGQVGTIVDAVGNVSTQTYDDQNRLTATINPLGFRTTYSYDADCKLQAVRDPLGKTTTYTYTSRGWPQSTINPLAKATTTSYDLAGNTTEVRNARGKCFTFLYDAAGRMTVQIDPLLRRTTYVLDGNGNATTHQDAKGGKTTYTYDKLDRETARQYADNTRVTQAYDDMSGRTLLHDATGKYTYTYSLIGELATATDPANQQITYNYDNLSRRSSMVDPDGGRFTYNYDNAGRMDFLLNPQAEKTTFTYDAAGKRQEIWRANNDRTSFVYDAASRLTNIHHRKGTATTLGIHTYSYNSAGIPTSLTEQVSTTVTYTTSWKYDDAYQMTFESRTTSTLTLFAETMTYDNVGNRLTVRVAGGTETTYTYDDADQNLTKKAGATWTTYTYDNNGNLQVEQTGANKTTYTWDDENRLVTTAFPGGSPVSNVYTFNGDGQRVKVVDSVGTKKLIWDLENILMETDNADATQVVYTLEPAGYGNLISQRRSSTTHVHLADLIGSIRMLGNSSGDASDSYFYKAFGETSASTGSTTNTFRWVGEPGYYYDVDRLAYYLRARP